MMQKDKRKVVFLKLGLPHFCDWANNRFAMEKKNCSNPEMYNCCRSCWIMVLILPTYIFGEVVIETSKIHN
jgi:hypothetical protein